VPAHRAALPRRRGSGLRAAGLTREERTLVRRRDWRGLIHYGVIFFMLEKLGAVVGVSNLHIYAAMRGRRWKLSSRRATRRARCIRWPARTPRPGGVRGARGLARSRRCPLVAAAKAKPGGVTVATPGNGATPHLAMELFQHTAGLKLSHVPYKGGAQAITDVLGGHVDVVAVNALEVLPLVKAGKLRVLAVMSAERSAVLPGVPTVAESGYPGFEASVWYGFVAPAGCPSRCWTRCTPPCRRRSIRRKCASSWPRPAACRCRGRRAVREAAQGDAARYGKLIREANIKPD
jgi:hypothetical protein